MRPAEERFWEKVGRSDACWEWLAFRNADGYGVFQGANRRLVGAHRFAYELLIGPIPEGLQLDHLCRNRGCVRPDHLEPVDNRTNTIRGLAPTVNRQRAAEQTHCKNGHEFTVENTRIAKDARGRDMRKCRTCDRERAAVRRKRVACPTCGVEVWAGNLALHQRRRHP